MILKEEERGEMHVCFILLQGGLAIQVTRLISGVVVPSTDFRMLPLFFKKTHTHTTPIMNSNIPLKTTIYEIYRISNIS